MDNQLRIIGTRYVLAVQDLKKSSDFYIDQLGFKSVWAGEGWHFISRGNCMIMLGECADDVPAAETNNHSYFGYLEVENIDQLYDEFIKKKVEILTAPENKPWGQREFAIRTIDGHRIMFGQEYE
ncbi:MAG: VOC family protein [Marinoscillum sp.]